MTKYIVTEDADVKLQFVQFFGKMDETLKLILSLTPHIMKPIIMKHDTLKLHFTGLGNHCKLLGLASLW